MNSGSYYVNVSFETFTVNVVRIFSDYTTLVVKKTHGKDGIVTPIVYVFKVYACVLCIYI